MFNRLVLNVLVIIAVAALWAVLLFLFGSAEFEQNFRSAFWLMIAADVYRLLDGKFESWRSARSQ